MRVRDRGILAVGVVGLALCASGWVLTAGGSGPAGQSNDDRAVVGPPPQQQPPPLLPGDCTPAGTDGGMICREEGGPPSGQKQPGEMITPEQAEKNLQEDQDRLPDG